MRSYREAQQVADALSDLGVLLRFACMWDPKAYKARQHTVAGLRKDTSLIRWVQHPTNHLLLPCGVLLQHVCAGCGL
jgi:hypothetical protein